MRIQEFTRRLVLAALVPAAVAILPGCTAFPGHAKTGQLIHVGVFWLKEPGNAEHRQKLIAAAHSFAREIPEVRSLAIGRTLPKTSPYTDASFDVSFVMRFESKAALDRYCNHPVHTKAAQEVYLPLCDKILFYDFTSE